jgi:hypothetical protein
MTETIFWQLNKIYTLNNLHLKLSSAGDSVLRSRPLVPKQVCRFATGFQQMQHYTVE